MKAFLLSPEPPYPLESGGAFRVASLVHYFARIAEIDLVLLSDSGAPATLPPGLVRSQQVIALPKHSRGSLARYIRNSRRAVRGVPPLVDRVAGFGPAIERAAAGCHYDFGIVEHSWCAPYVRQLNRFCNKTILDLHNIESLLHERCVTVTDGLVRLGHRRFAKASRKLEAELLPLFASVLATSEEDAKQIHRIAPDAHVLVYPNSLPQMPVPAVTEHPEIVFSGNFEYHPNIDAVAFLVREIWPRMRQKDPALRLRLVGRGDTFVRHLLPADPQAAGIDLTGPVEDARAEIARARVVIAPLRIGTGTRIKILEAWAAARPVVATPLAAEGLAVSPGTNISLASGAAEFAEEVARLLGDSAERGRLGAAGRQTFENYYTWDAAWRQLDSDLQLTQPSGVNGYTEGSDAHCR